MGRNWEKVFEELEDKVGTNQFPAAKRSNTGCALSSPMAYYHRKAILDRYEQFELNTDIKKTTKPAAEKQDPKDFGSGIAAQFGLIKKPATVKSRKISEDIPLKKKKIPSLEDEHGSKSKHSKRSNTDEQKSQTSDKRFSPEISHHKKQKRSNDYTTQKRNAPREVDLGLTSHADVDNSSDSGESITDARDKVHSQKNITKKSKQVGTDSSSQKKNKKKYPIISDSSDTSDDVTAERIRFNRKNSNENSVQSKHNKYGTFKVEEKNRKKSRTYDEDNDDDDDDVNDNDKVNDDVCSDNSDDDDDTDCNEKLIKRSNPISASKSVSKYTSINPQDTYTIPKRNKTITTSNPLTPPTAKSSKVNDNSNGGDKNRSKEPPIRRHSNESNGNSNEKDKNTTHRSKEPIIRRHSNEPNGNKSSQRKNSNSMTTDNPPQNVSLEATNISSKVRLKSSTNTVKHATGNHVDKQRSKSSLESAFEKGNTLNIKKEPEDIVPTKPLTDNHKNNVSKESLSVLPTQCSNTPTGKQNIKKEPHDIKINLGNGQYYFGNVKTIRSSKGEDLFDWFKLTNDRYKQKTTKTDNVQNYFITLHSRFKVMETMEMNDLEVLPEDEVSKAAESDPIRIFTNLSKDHYKLYLDESCMKSIPDLIITRLYPTV